ncbi:hypothetical protein PPERSA_11500 [Pseudocohnilembus persalinus]|uniref:Uncharacterized protein n=1 Tax=Pseudocohnilembus persalinus TaxID=266149 RepID=A0A0V0QX73_PSEPJ|nr:hypothetical protein PPERSA_11500 [Pseudocohnilembus persalinus]|eukprot:KRX06855.1 hypothetical protein PPERSA_11500 [Pseudocohnilembus persalinus]
MDHSYLINTNTDILNTNNQNNQQNNINQIQNQFNDLNISQSGFNEFYKKYGLVKSLPQILEIFDEEEENLDKEKQEDSQQEISQISDENQISYRQSLSKNSKNPKQQNIDKFKENQNNIQSQQVLNKYQQQSQNQQTQKSRIFLDQSLSEINSKMQLDVNESQNSNNNNSNNSKDETLNNEQIQKMENEKENYDNQSQIYPANSYIDDLIQYNPIIAIIIQCKGIKQTQDDNLNFENQEFNLKLQILNQNMDIISDINSSKIDYVSQDFYPFNFNFQTIPIQDQIKFKVDISKLFEKFQEDKQLYLKFEINQQKFDLKQKQSVDSQIFACTTIPLIYSNYEYNNNQADFIQGLQNIDLYTDDRLQDLINMELNIVIKIIPEDKLIQNNQKKQKKQ